jgi:hypothetical protein
MAWLWSDRPCQLATGRRQRHPRGLPSPGVQLSGGACSHLLEQADYEPAGWGMLLTTCSLHINAEYRPPTVL